MSTCPGNDIHSVYIDNELPETYVALYEAHIKSCPKCAAKLASITAVNTALRSDEFRMSSDAASPDKSWERLQTRLRYAKTTKRAYRFSEHNFRYAFSAAVAAAVLALIIPVRLLRTPVAIETAAINPIARNGSVRLAKNTVVINGNIEQPHAFVPSEPSASYGTDSEYRTAFDVSFGAARFDAARTGERQLEDVDLFRPDFANGNVLAIKLSIPEIGFVPPAADIDFANGQLVGSLK